MPGVISDNIFSKCLTAASTDINRCGAITLCSISPTTSDQLEDIYQDTDGNWRIIGALLEADFQGKACQVKQNGMWDWFMASGRKDRSMSPQKIKNGLYKVQPFIEMETKGFINNEYWTVSSGDGTGGTHNGNAYDFYCEIVSQTGMEADPRWFPERLRVFIRGRTSGGIATETAWKIVETVQVTSTRLGIYCVSENHASSLWVTKLTVLANGVLRRGTANVMDAEKYCPQIPGINTTKLTPFFTEQTRWALCEDELYRQYIGHIKANNPYFAKFGDIEAVELNKQVMEDFERRMVNAFWFQKPLSHQSMAEWDQLEQVSFYSDDNDGNYIYLPFEGRCYGRRANATGFYEQHAECGMVRDLEGFRLNIPELQAALYKIKRVREDNGIPVEVIEMFTDSYYAVQLAQGFLRYASNKSEGLLRLNMDLQAKGKQTTPLGFAFTEFYLDYPNVKIRIVTHKYFDDLADAMTKSAGTQDRSGRFLWIFDASSNYVVPLGSKSIVNRSGDIQRIAEVDQNFLCVMETAKRTHRLNSMLYTVVAECPKSSLFLENFDTEIPEHEAAVGSPTDYYGDYDNAL